MRFAQKRPVHARRRPTRFRHYALGGISALALTAAGVAPATADELEEMKKTMEALQERIEQIESQRAADAERAHEEAFRARAEAELARREAAAARAEADELRDQPWLELGGAERKEASVVNAVTTANDYVVGGDFPNSIKIPGTDTSLAIYGFIKGDFIHNFGAKRPNANLLLTGIIPVDGSAGSGRNGDTFFGVNPSQINFETRTPTEYGELGTHIQIDMFNGFGDENSANEASVGLRLAVGHLGPFYAGQDWTAFMDLSTYPETADFEGPNAEIFSRVPQIKWMDSAGGGFSYAVALDNPESNFIPLPGTTVANTKIDKLPDLVGHVRQEGSWGHVQLAGQLRQVGYEIDSTLFPTTPAINALPNRSDTAIGWGLALYGQLLDPFGLHPNDKLTGLFAYGEGIRYIIDTGLNALQTDGGVNPVTGDFELEQQHAAMVWYQHWWSNTTRSTVVYGLVETDPLSFAPATHFKRSQYLVGNLFWSPWPRVNLGIEGQYGEKKQNDGRNGEAFQVQGTAVFLF